MDIKSIKSFVFSNGVKVINVCPHELNFEDNGEVVTVSESGIKINAKIENKLLKEKNGVRFYKSTPIVDEESLEILEELESHFPDTLIVGSVLAAQAYPGKVVGMVPVLGYERVAPSEKRMRTDAFIVF